MHFVKGLFNSTFLVIYKKQNLGQFEYWPLNACKRKLSVYCKYLVHIFTHPSSSRPIIAESYSIVAIFNGVTCHPLVGVLTTLDCSSHNTRTTADVNLQRDVHILLKRQEVRLLLAQILIILLMWHFSSVRFSVSFLLWSEKARSEQPSVVSTEWLRVHFAWQVQKGHQRKTSY